MADCEVYTRVSVKEVAALEMTLGGGVVGLCQLVKQLLGLREMRVAGARTDGWWMVQGSGGLVILGPLRSAAQVPWG